ncbi:MAG: hypothetical protein ACOYMA_07710 [Bacteroidia bacterium]
MALCRCIEEHANPQGRVNEYVIAVEPVGYTETASICGIPDCKNAGLIWLTKAEFVQYQNNERIFRYANNTTKVKVI